MRVAAAPEPLWEVLFSRARLQEPAPRAAFRPWILQSGCDPGRARQMRAGARALTVLAPMSGGYFPDFLTPPDAGDDLESQLEAVMSTPRRRLRQELQRLAVPAPAPAWVGQLAMGDVMALTRLCQALRGYHQAAIAPHQELIQSSIDADRAHLGHQLLADGVEGLLAGLQPLMRWRPPVLEVDYIVDQDLRLEGRGLRLVPSFFCQWPPVTLADPELTPVLIYPIAAEIRAAQVAATSGRRFLDALMGSTRAAVLAILDPGRTGAEIARRLKISPAAASRHLSVLRDAGLVTSRRDTTAIVHTLTPLGRALLNDRASVGAARSPAAPPALGRQLTR